MSNVDFDFDIQDDLQITEDYQTVETGPRPALPGNYRVRITKQDFKRDKEGNVVRWRNTNGDPTYPVFNLQMAEIVDPIEQARKVSVFTDVATYPQTRNNTQVSPAADLLKAISADVTAANTGEVIKQVSERILNEDITARYDYVVYDKGAAAHAVESLGYGAIPNMKDPAVKKAINKAYRTAETRGWGKIRQSNIQRGMPNLPLDKFVCADLETVIPVRPQLTVFYPAGETVNLGPDKKALEFIAAKKQ